MTNILKESIYKKKKKKINKTCCKGKEKNKKEIWFQNSVCFIENFLVVDKNCHDHKRKVILLFQLSLVWLWLFCYPSAYHVFWKKSLWNSRTPRQQMIKVRLFFWQKGNNQKEHFLEPFIKYFHYKCECSLCSQISTILIMKRQKKLFNRSVCVVYHWISTMLYPKDIAKKYRKWVNEWMIMLPWTWL